VAFGAIILLLVLTGRGPAGGHRARAHSMNGQLLRLQQELPVIRGDTDQLNRELQGRITQLAPSAALRGCRGPYRREG
jgi:hypothetical protein